MESIVTSVCICFQIIRGVKRDSVLVCVHVVGASKGLPQLASLEESVGGAFSFVLRFRSFFLAFCVTLRLHLRLFVSPSVSICSSNFQKPNLCNVNAKLTYVL